MKKFGDSNNCKRGKRQEEGNPEERVFNSSNPSFKNRNNRSFKFQSRLFYRPLTARQILFGRFEAKQFALITEP